MKNILNSIIGRAYEQKYFYHMTIDFANSEPRIIALFSQIRVCVQCDIFLFQQIVLLFRFFFLLLTPNIFLLCIILKLRCKSVHIVYVYEDHIRLYTNFRFMSQ